MKSDLGSSILTAESRAEAQVRAEFWKWVDECGCDTDGAWSAWQAAWRQGAALAKQSTVETIARRWDGCLAPMFDFTGNPTGPIDIGATIRADEAGGPA